MKTIIAVLLFFTCNAQARDNGQWAISPNKEFFDTLRRPDIEDTYGPPNESLFCCGEADVVETRFRVETDLDGDNPYPLETWYAWLEDDWVRIPLAKIVPGHAPDGRAYLFANKKAIFCFVRPRGGL